MSVHRYLLFHHTLFTFIYIHTLLHRLALQTATVKRVPRIIRIRIIREIRSLDSCSLVVADVDIEVGDAAGECGAVAADLEVGALGSDAGTRGGIIEVTLFAHQQDALVVGIELGALIRAEESHAGVATGAVVIASVGGVDDYTGEYGILDVVATLPFNNIRCTGLERRNGIAEGEVERGAADAGCGERTGHSPVEGASANRYVERQTDRVPLSVLIEPYTTVQSRARMNKNFLYRIIVNVLFVKTQRGLTPLCPYSSLFSKVQAVTGRYSSPFSLSVACLRTHSILLALIERTVS